MFAFIGRSFHLPEAPARISRGAESAAAENAPVWWSSSAGKDSERGIAGRNGADIGDGSFQIPDPLANVVQGIGQARDVRLMPCCVALAIVGEKLERPAKFGLPSTAARPAVGNGRAGEERRLSHGKPVKLWATFSGA
jgi:hypothetical protein